MRKKQKWPKRLFREMRSNQEYWPHRTNPKGHRYFFHPKHHGAGSQTDSCWKSDVGKAEEFGIFEIAVRLELSDQNGNLFNVRKGADGTVLELGAFHEQIARFWKPAVADSWHGHPLWPVITVGSNNRSRQEYRPDRTVFRRLVEQKVLSERDCHRLNSGKNI